MLPIDLVKIIKKYLNSNKTLLLADLIDYANDLITGSMMGNEDNKESMDNLSDIFNESGFTGVVKLNPEYNSYFLSLNQVDYINNQQIIDFIDTLLDFIEYLDKQGYENLSENLFIINRLLYKYRFNNYLLIMYNQDDKVIYRWLKNCNSQIE